jgi:methylated-DNA-[protein]-cysteine S-methyltransferase
VEVRFDEDPPHVSLDDALGHEVATQIVEFLCGDRTRFDVPIDWSMMPPAHAAILRTLYEQVGWGDTVSYGELAAMAGYPGAARAAGTACRKCPWDIVVPAYRAIAAGGRIGGYGGRVDIKRLLLAREGSGPFRD